MQHCSKCPDAVAEIRGGEVPQLSGCVELYQENGGVLVVARLAGLPESAIGFFGFHIHQGESRSGTDFSETGSHYNPTVQAHPKHTGDLLLLLSCRGNVYLPEKTDRFTARHYWTDCGYPFNFQPVGNAGKKIACGVICKRQ